MTFENLIASYNERVDAKKTPMPTNPSNLSSTFLSPLASRQCQLIPRRQGKGSHPPERVAASVAR